VGSANASLRRFKVRPQRFGSVVNIVNVGSISDRQERSILAMPRPISEPMTRAKEHLHLMVPQRFFTHNQRANGDC
jgi:hypothetical protein